MHRRIYDDTHEMFRQTVREFVKREVQPHFEHWERAGSVARDLYRSAGAAGLLAMGVPAEYGGGDNDDFRFCSVLIEEFCHAGVMTAVQGLTLHSTIVLPYFQHLGNEEQKRRWLPDLATGASIGAIAMTEPGAGSDLSAIRTSATVDGDALVINGSKQFISNGTTADLVVVACRTSDAPDRRGAGGLSLIVVEADRPGFTRSEPLRKIGQHAADTAELFFDDVRVPVGHLLGQEGKGFYQLVSMLPRERLSIAITAIAHAEAAFGWSLEYCKERTAFGQPIASFQNSRFTLASLRTELDIAQVFLDRQVEAWAEGDLTPEDAAEAKWWCTELNKRVLDACLQLHGGYGYMEEYPIARAWRDGRSMSIYGGTTEIMKELIGRRVLGI